MMTKRSGMETPMRQLLPACLRQDPEPDVAARLSRMPRADWESLAALAKEQRVRPLLHQRLKRLGVETEAARPTLRALRRFYRKNALWNLRLFTDLNSIVTAFRAEKIPVIALKGAHLAPTVYGNIAFREMNDLDLLVPPDRLGRAGEIMIARGWRPRQPYDLDLILETDQHLPRFLKPGSVPVELHWSITKPGDHCAIDPGALWDRAAPVQIAGCTLLGFSREDLLLHLCLHTSYQHQFQFGLRPFCDIAALISHYGPTLDSEAIPRRAAARRWRRGVFLSLALARDLVGAAAPEGVLREFTPTGFDESIAETAEAQLFTDKAFAHSLSTRAAKVLDRPDSRGKFRQMIARIFIPRKNIAKMYRTPSGSWRIHLYYLVRVKDLIFRYGGVIGALRRGNRDLVQLTHRKRVLADWLEKG